NLKDRTERHEEARDTSDPQREVRDRERSDREREKKSTRPVKSVMHRETVPSEVGPPKVDGPVSRRFDVMTPPPDDDFRKVKRPGSILPGLIVVGVVIVLVLVYMLIRT